LKKLEGKAMQDLLHFGRINSLLTLLKPYVKMLGPWPFVTLVAVVLAFLGFGEYHVFGLLNHVLSIVDHVFQAALAAFFLLYLSASCWWVRSVHRLFAWNAFPC
jgi:hypothetical protein